MTRYINLLSKKKIYWYLLMEKMKISDDDIPVIRESYERK